MAEAGEQAKSADGNAKTSGKLKNTRDMRRHWAGQVAQTAHALGATLRGGRDGKVEPEAFKRGDNGKNPANTRDLAAKAAGNDDASALEETLGRRRATVLQEVETYIQKNNEKLMDMDVTSDEVRKWVQDVETHVERWIAHLQASWVGLEEGQFEKASANVRSCMSAILHDKRTLRRFRLRSVAASCRGLTSTQGRLTRAVQKLAQLPGSESMLRALYGLEALNAKALVLASVAAAVLAGSLGSAWWLAKHREWQLPSRNASADWLATQATQAKSWVASSWATATASNGSEAHPSDNKTPPNDGSDPPNKSSDPPNESSDPPNESSDPPGLTPGQAQAQFDKKTQTLINASAAVQAAEFLAQYKQAKSDMFNRGHEEGIASMQAYTTIYTNPTYWLGYIAKLAMREPIGATLLASIGLMSFYTKARRGGGVPLELPPLVHAAFLPNSDRHSEEDASAANFARDTGLFEPDRALRLRVPSPVFQGNNPPSRSL